MLSKNHKTNNSNNEKEKAIEIRIKNNLKVNIITKKIKNNEQNIKENSFIRVVKSDRINLI